MTGAASTYWADQRKHQLEAMRAGGPRVQYTEEGHRIYEPDGLQLAKFLFDRSPIAIIRGPWGSGTSTACCQRIWQHAIEQNVSEDGFRKSRWFVMRDTYPRIETTTLATWLEWFPESQFGKLYTGTRPYLHEIRVGNIKLDVFFGAVDDAASDAMFKSLEPTGWWWNELEFAPMKAFFAAHGRVGRYPRAVDGGSKWSGTIADLNAPPENHWLPMLTGEVPLPDDMPLDEAAAYDIGKIEVSGIELPPRQTSQTPAGLTYFVQPPAVFPVRDAANRIVDWRVNPAAENLRWLADLQAEPPEKIPGETYYHRARRGKTIRWIEANLGNKIVPMVEGDPVWANYNEDTHLSVTPLDPIYGVDVWVGVDFGRRPAAVIMQDVNGQHQYQYDTRMRNAGAKRFAPVLRALLAEHYPWVFSAREPGELHVYGDPKGQDKPQTDEITAYEIFRGEGLPIQPAPVPTNAIATRLEAVEVGFDTMVNGQPKILISPRAVHTKMALGGGYHYPTEKPQPMSERKPVKDHHSDVADAMQYCELGIGSGRSMIAGRAARGKPQGYGRRRSYHRG